MTNFVNLLSVLSTGKAMAEETAMALYENVLAVLEGSTGAPEPQQAFHQTAMTAGTFIAYNYGEVDLTYSSTYVEFFKRRFVEHGTVRVEFRHALETGTVGTSDARIQVNGVTVQSWSRGSDSYLTRSHDVTIQPGDVLTVDHRHDIGGTYGSRIRDLELKTNGETLCQFVVSEHVTIT